MWYETGNFLAHERREYSQYGEEGLIDYIFENIPTVNQRLIDLGAGDGVRLSNTYHLIQRGWRGVRVDVAAGRDVVGVKLTAENVCDTLAKYNMVPEPDFMSLDVDGNDWWILRALLRGGYTPRVFVCEINPTLPRDPPVTVEYDPTLSFANTNYFGASLSAFQQLAEAYGYQLVFIHMGINAFFVRRELMGVARINCPFTPNTSWPADPRAWHLIGVEEIP
jgi:hypothetical protein